MDTGVLPCAPPVDAVKELDRGIVPVDADGARSTGRPTAPLPWSQLLNLSAYWLGLTAIWAGLDATILPARLTDLVGGLELGRATALVVTAGVVMPILIQPLTGALSDYTVSRWGRRKPYIAIGATLDVVFLIALATSNTYAAILIFYVLLQFSSNF